MMTLCTGPDCGKPRKKLKPLKYLYDLNGRRVGLNKGSHRSAGSFQPKKPAATSETKSKTLKQTKSQESNDGKP
jgi:hypothetical protein